MEKVCGQILGECVAEGDFKNRRQVIRSIAALQVCQNLCSKASIRL